MANNYKILRKARMADDLFVPDPDNAAWAQEEAEREWARDLDLTGGANGSTVIQGSASFPELAPPASEDEQTEVKALVHVPSPASAPRGWAEILGEITGDRGLARIRTLGVCGVNGQASEAATAALARWVAQNSHTSTLLVEAHLGEPRLAATFQVDDAGLLDSLAGADAGSLVQATATPNLRLLASGARPGSSDRSKLIQELPGLIRSLRERHPSILVELPAVNDAAFTEIQASSLVDAVLLVADPATVGTRDLAKAADKVRAAGVQLAGSVLDTKDVREPRPSARTGFRWFS